jgi:CheY-like chemotaxis protein
MPVMTGLEVQQWLAKSVHPPPIVFVTASVEQVAALAGRKGVVEVLTKPVDSENLIQAVEGALGRGRQGRPVVLG